MYKKIILLIIFILYYMIPNKAGSTNVEFEFDSGYIDYSFIIDKNNKVTYEKGKYPSYQNYIF